MLAAGLPAKTFLLFLRTRLILEAVLGIGTLILAVAALGTEPRHSVLHAIGWVLILAAFFFPIARSLGFLFVAGLGSLRLQRHPDKPPSLILLAAALDLPVLVALALGSGALPWKGAGSTGLAVVLLLWDVALIALMTRKAPTPDAVTADAGDSRPPSIVLRAAPTVAHGVTLLFVGRFLAATQQVAPPHELHIDKLPDVPGVPALPPGLQKPVVDDGALWSLHSGMGTTTLSRVDLQQYVMQYRFPLPPEIAGKSTDLRGLLRHPSGERLLLIHSSQYDRLWVLAVRPEGGVRTLSSVDRIAAWSTPPPKTESWGERLTIMGWTLSGEKLELVTSACLYFELALNGTAGQPSQVRRLPGCQGHFDEVRWAARDSAGWRLLVEQRSGHTWLLVAPDGVQPIPGIDGNSDVRIDLSPGNILPPSVLPPQYVFAGGKLVAIRPPPQAPADFENTSGMRVLDAQGLHYTPYFCKGRMDPCLLPAGSDWIRTDGGHDGLQVSSDPTQPGQRVAPRQVSTVFVPYIVTLEDRIWLVTQSDSYVIALRKPASLVPISLMDRVRRLVPTDQESLQRKVRWLGARAGGYEGVGSLQSTQLWNLIKYLPLLLGPIFSLLCLLLRLVPHARRPLQLAALAYLMLCLIAGPLFFSEIDAF